MDDEDRQVFEKRVGTVLRGKWRLDRLLGVGGMAAVYAATHSIGRQEAIKILHPEVARSKDLRARFEREAQAVNQFRHPGVVEIRDIDVTDEGEPFLVMELLEGESLQDRAQRAGGIETAEICRIVDELLDVLAAAHAQGIIHRDIKPDNLFLLRDGRLKVLDFGIAHVRDGVKTELRTRAGSTLGTVSYMAPEQVRGTGVDHRADLFSVGATMFRLIAKRRLHEARTDSELLVKMATQPAPRLGTVVQGAPPGLCLIVDRALAFDRDRRYPDAKTMQEDVRAVLRGQLPSFAAGRLSHGDLPGTSEAAPMSVVAGGGASTQASFEPTIAQVGTELSMGAAPASSLTSAPTLAVIAPVAAAPAPATASAPRSSSKAGVIAAAAGALLTVLLIVGLWLALRGPSDEGAGAPGIDLPSGSNEEPHEPSEDPSDPAAPTAPSPGGATTPGRAPLKPRQIIQPKQNEEIVIETPLGGRKKKDKKKADD
ncbi:MAG TPA: serine/threonine-protein kinase [Candidatus Nanopelagicales bacterium]|nr:serine/threonine-protein kinase [Candidatus Nanopelagicales bacterium]